MFGRGIPRLLAQLGSRLDYWRRVNGSSHFLKVFGFSRDRLSFKKKKNFFPIFGVEICIFLRNVDGILSEFRDKF